MLCGPNSTVIIWSPLDGLMVHRHVSGTLQMPTGVHEGDTGGRTTDTNTITFHHKRVTNPTTSAADAITTADHTLSDTIKNNMKTDLAHVDIEEL